MTLMVVPPFRGFSDPPGFNYFWKMPTIPLDSGAGAVRVAQASPCCARHTCQLDSHYIAGDSVASLETLREVGETLHHFSIERTIILKIKTSFNVPYPMLCLTKSTSVLTKQAKRIDKKERKMNNRAYNLS